MKYLDHTAYLNSEDLYILVHPFFDEHTVSQNYNNYLKKVIAEHEGPILTLEDEIGFDNTVKFVKDTFPFAARFFIKTKPCNTNPKNMTFKKLYEFIRFINSDKQIGLMGGFYDGNTGNGYKNGCLGSLEYLLNANEFKTYAIEECTFTRASPYFNLITNSPFPLFKKIKLLDY